MVREVSSVIVRRPDTLDSDDQVMLKEVLAHCPHLDAMADHVNAFAEMLTSRCGKRLNTWIGQVEIDDLPDLHRFTVGLRRGHAAVLNGLTLPYSSGAVKGKVN